MKQIIFSLHSRENMIDRGTDENEIIETIHTGEKISAKKDRIAFRKNFTFESLWKNKFYRVKQVMPIVKEEGNTYVVITVYVFYFGGS